MRFTENLTYSSGLRRSISSPGFDELNIRKEEEYG